jgi:glycosyltransferase involved in cell wall biosynthesis
MVAPLSTAVVLCTHDGERHVHALLDSVAAQTQPVDEIHIFDWASRDGTLAAIDRWRRDSQARSRLVAVHAMTTAPGPARSFLHALAAVADTSSAELLFIADQDDLWSPEKVAVATAEYQSSPFDLAHSDVQVFHESRGETVGSFYGGSSPFACAEHRPDYSVLITNPAIGMTMCVRRAWMSTVRPAFDLYWVMHDWALMILCWMQGGRLRYIPLPLVVYRQHDRNALGAAGTKPAWRKLKSLPAHVANVRQQLRSAQAAADLLHSPQRARTQVHRMQTRLAQARTAAASGALALRYRLMLSLSLLLL